jgi:hypothetical protein
MTKSEILKEFEVFSIPTGGIGNWITQETHADIFERLARIDVEPLSAVQLNQLFVLGHEAPVSDAFFRYYWLEAPAQHPYPVMAVTGYSGSYSGQNEIGSIRQLKWGLLRLYIDAMLYFGNVRTAFRSLRDCTSSDLKTFFDRKRFDTDAVKRRGPALPLLQIAKDNRYLISEMACKSYGEGTIVDGDLRKALIDAYKSHVSAGHSAPTIRALIDGSIAAIHPTRQTEFIFSADEVLNEQVQSEADIESKFDQIARKFFEARQAALKNTRYYLSMVNDLDVYVATSMRTRDDFRNMANTCELIFSDERLRALNLRYFDPTLSAAGGHEDKGLIECLMVKCAKVLVYCAGDKESYGKDAEAAMALSLGKPVIFYCDQQQRGRFYRDIHPLSRLIEFETGVAVGAMVTDKIEEVSELLFRIFENQMLYSLEQSKPGFLRLKELLTDSVVRLQTNDRLLAETFWNHYHKDRDRERKEGVGGV